jgi:hypothetical protein
MVGGGGRLLMAMGMAAIVMLAGCASPPSTASPSIISPTAAPVAGAASAPLLPPGVEPAKSEVTALAVPPIEREPVRLVGLSPAEVERLLGRPHFVRHDGQAQIWRFANQSCILDLFFYREVAGFAVRHYEFRSAALDGFVRPCAGDVRVLLQAQSG